jgi:asparagine synthase (glutamine-hydrolysing)
MQSVDTRLYLAEDILTKVDRASMAVSLEVRAPFLDPRVAEFAASLPCNYKLHGQKTKYILKKAVKEMLPSFVTRRGKKGFGVPVAEWLKEKLRPLARDPAVAGARPPRRSFQRKLRRAFAGRTRTRHRESSQATLDAVDV